MYVKLVAMLYLFNLLVKLVPILYIFNGLLN